MWTSLATFVVFYSALLVIDVALLAKYVRIGPRQAAEPFAGRAPRAGAEALLPED